MAACQRATLDWAARSIDGFAVQPDSVLKAITASFPALRIELLQRVNGTAARVHPQLLAAATSPVLVDIGAGAYDDLLGADGSDALLLAKVCDVPCEIHAFEMEATKARTLEEIYLKMQPSITPRTTLEVHRVGVGEGHSTLRAAPMAGTNKLRTLTLAGVGKQTRTRRLDFMTNVTSLDAWASSLPPRADGSSRPARIFYVKIDTNGHEPPVFRGMMGLFSRAPPLYISFEYSWGWDPLFAQNKHARDERRRVTRGQPHLRQLTSLGAAPTPPANSLARIVANLTAARYAVYFLHKRGAVRVDGHWWSDSYELELDEQYKARAPESWFDLFAAQHGPAQRAFESLFIARPLPCLSAMRHRVSRHRQPPAACARSEAISVELGPACAALWSPRHETTQ